MSRDRRAGPPHAGRKIVCPVCRTLCDGPFLCIVCWDDVPSIDQNILRSIRQQNPGNPAAYGPKLAQVAEDLLERRRHPAPV